jgi:hypothetical protein
MKIDLKALAAQANLVIDSELAEAQLKLFSTLLLGKAFDITRDDSDPRYQGQDPWGQKGAMKQGRRDAGYDILMVISSL